MGGTGEVIYSEENIKYDMVQVLGNHPHNSEVRKAVYELAELMDINLESNKVQFPARIYKEPFKDEVIFRTLDDTEEVDVVSKVRTAFAAPTGLWGGTKVRVTIERLVD